MKTIIGKITIDILTSIYQGHGSIILKEIENFVKIYIVFLYYHGII